METRICKAFSVFCEMNILQRPEQEKTLYAWPMFHGVSLFLQLYSLVPDRQIKRLLRLVGMLRAFVYFQVIEQSSPKLPQNGQTKLE